MLLPAACSPAPAAYGSAAAATSCRESELCTGTLALEGCASVSGRHDRGDEGRRSGICKDQPGGPGSAATARLARLRLGKRRPRLRLGLGRPRLRLGACAAVSERHESGDEGKRSGSGADQPGGPGSAAPARLARLRLGKRRPRLRFGLGRPRLRLACCLQFILTTQASSSMQNWTAEMIIT